MQKLTSKLPSWDKTKTSSKKGFDTVYAQIDRLGNPINKLSNKIGSEAFWPTTLDKESDKAARILKSFCKDGFYEEEDRPSTFDKPNEKSKQKVLKRIPQKVIQNAVGLAIFTTMRTGLWVSGAGGSGILIARKEDGSWSPPSGIMLHTAGLGFLVGVDIYDCVVVINSRKSLESFTKIRATLGGEISAVAGPVGVGGVLENDGKWKQANMPVFTYLKSRGFYAGIQIDGTVIIERTDENERFYGERIGVADILAGKARHPPYEIKLLMETVKAAEGRTDVDTRLMEVLDNQPAPGDVDLDSSASTNGHIFGIPEPEDPDPFGVLALEKQGLEIREAGTGSRPVSTQFEFKPSPTSPVYSTFLHRRNKSIDTLASNRASYMSNRTTRTSMDRSTQTMEMGTQTDDTPATSPSHSDENKRIVEEDEKSVVGTPDEIDYTKVDLGPYTHLSHSQDFEGTTVNGSSTSHEVSPKNKPTLPVDDEEDEDEEEPVVFEAGAAQAATILKPQVFQAKGSVVDIPKRIPPPLPARNGARTSRTYQDQASGRTPSKDKFEEVDLHGVASPRASISPEKEEAAVSPRVSISSEKEEAPATSPRASISSEKEAAPIAMKDLEKHAEDNRSSHSIPEVHLEGVNVLESEPRFSGNKSDEDDFHSLPPTPLAEDSKDVKQ
ncbi:LAS seventeen-binding protein [Phlyctema vagabunda]|uniref:LAS seventeen-binding protein n=1 Tax=Phlyctema vagabunda TaxID=108571 RepID=A0ABR4P9W7_9HELO